MAEYSEKESRVLNRVQQDLPLVYMPWHQLSGELGLTPDDVMDIIRTYRDEGVIRNIAGIFSAEKLGYDISLVAFCVPDKKVAQAAEIINAHPGVSHNYLRDHRYNIWFTLAVPPSTSLQKEAARMADQAGAEDYLLLRNERMMKLGVKLAVGDGKIPSGNKSHQENYVKKGARKLSEREKEAVRLLQNDLLPDPRPFARLVDDNNTDMQEDELLDLADGLRKDGIMRGFRAVLRHRDAGYTANAMTAWKLDTGTQLDEVQEVFGEEPSISHLYLRTVYPGRWEYPLFAMIHARSEDELTAIIHGLEERSDLHNYQVLRSLREFKKERVKYFNNT